MQQFYYGEIYASTYDIGGDRPDILSLYLGRWEKAGRPEPVLDAMCGTGYFLSAFLEAGADVDGVDASEPMLRQCGMKVAGGSSTLYHQRLEEIDLPRRSGIRNVDVIPLAMVWRSSEHRRRHAVVASVRTARCLR